MQQTRARRIRLVAVLSWLLATGLTGTIAWRAVAVIDNGAPRTGVLSQSEVAAALATARATPRPTATSPAPTASGTPQVSPAPTQSPAPDPTPGAATPTARPGTTTPGRSTDHPAQVPPTPGPGPEPAPATQARTWAVPGGTVAASCSGSAITLLYATPQDGWTVEVGSAGPDQVEVELSRDGQETKVRATCVAGVPTQSTSSDSGDGAHPEHTGG